MKSIVKPALLGALILVLLIPLAMIQDVVRERSWHRDQVVNDIAESWTRAQILSGPWLTLDYEVTVEHREWDKEKEMYVTRPVVGQKHLLLRPVTSDISGILDVSHRYRGIFQVPVYSADLAIKARFDLGAIQESLDKEEGVVALKGASLEIGVTDARGFVASPPLTWQGSALETRPGLKSVSGNDGFHAPLDIAQLQLDGEARLTTAFQLRGIESLQVAPGGFDSHVSLTADWPHPSFIGSFLPSERTIDDRGFQSEWTVSAFAAGLSLAPETCLAVESFKAPTKVQPMGVRLYEPVDIYLLTERATKYGVLFLVVTFAVFWLTELLRKLSLHPVQYGLVGLALAIFFLLLLSLSEHISFGAAYLIATIACVGLIGTYVRPLAGHRASVLLGVFLTLLYGACYLILMLESHALLVGSMLMFSLLTAVMMLTRRMDWYAMTDGLSFRRTNKVAAPNPGT